MSTDLLIVPAFSAAECSEEERKNNMKYAAHIGLANKVRSAAFENCCDRFDVPLG